MRELKDALISPQTHKPSADFPPCTLSHGAASVDAAERFSCGLGLAPPKVVYVLRERELLPSHGTALGVQAGLIVWLRKLSPVVVNESHNVCLNEESVVLAVMSGR